MRRIFAIVIILALLGPSVLSLFGGVSTNFLWSILVMIAFAAVTFWWGKQLVVWVSIAAVALTLLPMPIWLRFRDDVPQMHWSQPAFERNWPFLICLVIVNGIGLYIASKLWTKTPKDQAEKTTSPA